MWTDRQFWKAATWRAFRTFCQTLAGVLAAYFSGFLSVMQTGTIQAPEVVDTGAHVRMWLAFLYAAGVSGLISLLQSIDRERAVERVAGEPGEPVPALTDFAANWSAFGVDKQPVRIPSVWPAYTADHAQASVPYDPRPGRPRSEAPPPADGQPVLFCGDAPR